MLGSPTRRNFFADWSSYAYKALQRLRYLEEGRSASMTVMVKANQVVNVESGFVLWQLCDGAQKQNVLCLERIHDLLKSSVNSPHHDEYCMMHVVIAKPRQVWCEKSQGWVLHVDTVDDR